MPGTAIQAGCLVCAIATATCPETMAQAAPESAAQSRIHIGPLSVAPTVAIRNVGRDSNVFNEARDPKSDLTATLAPGTQLWLRMGRAQLSGSMQLEAIFYDQYSGQGSVSTMNTARLEISLRRFRPFVAGSFLRLHERPSVEIDARVQRVEQAGAAGVAVALGPRTSASVSIDEHTVSFGGREGAIGRTLEHELDRSQQVRTIEIQYELTPLTTLLVDVQQERTRFAAAGNRNARGVRVLPGLVFRPSALVSGEVHVGFLDYTPDDPAVPPFSGAIAAVNVRSIIAGANELALSVDRNLFHSIESQIYYVQTSAGAAVTRQLNERWSVSGSASRLWLAYSRGTPTPSAPAGVGSAGAGSGGGAPALEVLATRPETVSSIGAGIGCRLTRTTLVTFSVGRSHRNAAVESGRYDNLRTLASVTYAIR